MCPPPIQGGGPIGPLTSLLLPWSLYFLAGTTPFVVGGVPFHVVILVLLPVRNSPLVVFLHIEAKLHLPRQRFLYSAAVLSIAHSSALHLWIAVLVARTHLFPIDLLRAYVCALLFVV